MKKVISVLLTVIICVISSGAFAAENIEYAKSWEKVSVKLSKTDIPEAVLVVSQFKSGKLIDLEIKKIVHPEDGYIMPTMIIEEGIDYKFYVYNNLESADLLFNCLELNYESPNRLFLVEDYEGFEFKRIE